VMAVPSRMPVVPPAVASTSDSMRNCAATCRRAAPSARRSPISPRRSSTEMTITLPIPMPPTRSATAPRRSSRVVVALATASRVVSASEGRLTATVSGCSGVGCRGEQCGDGGGLVGVGAHVDPGWVALVLEQLAGDREADQCRLVDLRCLVGCQVDWL